MKVFATLFLVLLVSLPSAVLASSPAHQKLFILEKKMGMGVLATEVGNKIKLTYNYRIRFQNEDQREQAVWKHVHDLQTQEEYVCHNQNECVNTKHKELKLVRSKDGRSFRVVGPAELIDYRFVEYRGEVVQVQSVALNSLNN